MLSRPWKRALLVLGLGLVLGGVAVAASAARVASLSSGRVFASEEVPERGVGLVLGARSHPDRPSAFLAARLDVAVDLFQRGKVRVLLVSGDNLARSNHETAMMRRYLEERGVPPEAVFPAAAAGPVRLVAPGGHRTVALATIRRGRQHVTVLIPVG